MSAHSERLPANRKADFAGLIAAWVASDWRRLGPQKGTLVPLTGVGALRSLRLHPKTTKRCRRVAGSTRAARNLNDGESPQAGRALPLGRSERAPEVRDGRKTVTVPDPAGRPSGHPFAAARFRGSQARTAREDSPLVRSGGDGPVGYRMRIGERHRGRGSGARPQSRRAGGHPLRGRRRRRTGEPDRAEADRGRGAHRRQGRRPHALLGRGVAASRRALRGQGRAHGPRAPRCRDAPSDRR